VDVRHHHDGNLQIYNIIDSKTVNNFKQHKQFRMGQMQVSNDEIDAILILIKGVVKSVVIR